jgi:ATP-dependent exoDNAse (exonuclease V) alpha subunit
MAELIYNTLQLKAIEEATSLKHKVFMISGAAGTGKSSSVKKIIQNLNDGNREMVLLCPSHKSKKVLQTMIDDPTLEYRTVQKHLGMVPKIHKDGQQTFEFSKYSTKEENVDVIFCDEISMLSTKMYETLLSCCNNLIVMGDKSQLLSPCDDPLDAKVLDAIPSITLTEQMRQSVPDNLLARVITLAKQNQLRDDNTPMEFNLDNTDDSLIVYDDLNIFIDMFINTEGTKRIIAFTNQAVDACNTLIRKQLNLPTYPIIGDTIVLQEPITRKVRNRRGKQIDEVIYQNGDEITIVDITEEDDTAIVAICTEPHQKITQKISIPKSMDIRQGILNALADDIKKKKQPQRWSKEFYPLKSSMAAWKFEYAQSVHKSQGSSLDHIFMIHKDMKKAWDQYARLFYVAITRAKQIAHIKI